MPQKEASAVPLVVQFFKSIDFQGRYDAFTETPVLTILLHSVHTRLYNDRYVCYTTFFDKTVKNFKLFDLYRLEMTGNKFLVLIPLYFKKQKITEIRNILHLNIYKKT